MTRKQLIEWLMPFEKNEDQRALKFFARLSIGESTEGVNVQLATESI